MQVQWAILINLRHHSHLEWQYQTWPLQRMGVWTVVHSGLWMFQSWNFALMKIIKHNNKTPDTDGNSTFRQIWDKHSLKHKMQHNKNQYQLFLRNNELLWNSDYICMGTGDITGYDEGQWQLQLWMEKISIGMHFHLHEGQQENRVPHRHIFQKYSFSNIDKYLNYATKKGKIDKIKPNAKLNQWPNYQNIRLRYTHL